MLTRPCNSRYIFPTHTSGYPCPMTQPHTLKYPCSTTQPHTSGYPCPDSGSFYGHDNIRVHLIVYTYLKHSGTHEQYYIHVLTYTCYSVVITLFRYWVILTVDGPSSVSFFDAP